MGKLKYELNPKGEKKNLLRGGFVGSKLKTILRTASPNYFCLENDNGIGIRPTLKGK